MTDSGQRKKGAILSYLSIIISTGVQLIYTPFLIRMLGQSEYGLYSLIASLIGYLTVLDLGFGNAVIVYTAQCRATNDYEKENKIQGMFKIIFYILSIITIILGLILYFNINNIFSSTMTTNEISKSKIMVIILIFNLALTFAFNIYSSIISAYEKFVYQKVIAIASTLFKPVIMIPLLFMGYKSVTMCVVITIINTFVLLSNYFYCKRKLKINIEFNGFDKKIFIEMFSYSFFIFLGVVVDKINWSVDQFILGAVSGTVAVSIYSIASQLNSLFINLSTAISGLLLPKMSKMVAKKTSKTQLTNEMIKVGRIQYIIIFYMTSLLVLVGKPFIIWWAGKEYELSYYVALLLIIPVTVPLIQNLGLSILQAMNKHKFRAIATSIMAIINIIISYFLAKKFGVIGSALGTTISLIICNIIIMNIYYKKSIGIQINRFWKEIIKMTIPLTIPIILTIILMKLTRINGLLGIIIYSSIYSLIYCPTIYFMSMNKYEKQIIEKILIKLHIKKVKYE